MKKRLLITFDYELFLGSRSGKTASCLFNPTNAIRQILKPYGIKAIFFVDTTYLYTLEKHSNQHPACKKDLEEIAAQLQELILDGHYVFPHLHPHWLDAQYLHDQHEFVLKNVNRYRFHNLDEADRKMVFSNSMRILSNIIHAVKPDYKINGYRAGGWSIQPFTDIKPYFEEYGIRYDFSVMTGTYLFSNAQYFDFSTAPTAPIYRFSDKECEIDPQGEFIELASSVIRLQPHVRVADKLLRKVLFKYIKDHSYGRGIGQQSKLQKDLKPASLKGHPPKDRRNEFVSMELLSVVKLQGYLKFFRERDYMHFVSHPKMLSQHNLNTFQHFLAMIYHDFSIETDFMKMVEEFEHSSNTSATN